MTTKKHIERLISIGNIAFSVQPLGRTQSNTTNIYLNTSSVPVQLYTHKDDGR
jgi:hypothetical protein